MPTDPVSPTEPAPRKTLGSLTSTDPLHLPSRDPAAPPAAAPQASTGKQLVDYGAGKSGTEAPTPAYLVPTMGEVASQEPTYYRSLFIVDSLMEDTSPQQPLDGPIDPLDKSGDDIANLRPAVGVLTVHEQVWQQTGLGLGNLLHSVCLAPGEVTQIAVTQWERTMTGTDSESVKQSESVSDEIEQNRAVNEVQRAVANEAQSGTSSTTASSSSAQVGASWLWGSAGGATSKTSAVSAQYSTGSRAIAADSTSAIAQSTAEKSQALRSRRQSVVREVSEKESESISTRILANYNRRHTLNVLFFEVLQKYQLTTTLIDWARCLFIPMRPLDFEKPGVIEDNQAQLLALFSDLGRRDLIDHLNRALTKDEREPAKYKSAEDYETQIKDLERAKGLAARYAQAAQGTVVETRVEAENPCYTKDGPTAFDIVREQVPDTAGMAAAGAEYDLLKKKYPELPSVEKCTAAMLDDMTRMATVRKAEAMMLPGLIFNRQREFLSQQLWLRMTPYQVSRALYKYHIEYRPPGKDATTKRVRLSTVVDPQPIGYFGNFLAFRWAFTAEEEQERLKFEATYIGKQKEVQQSADGRKAIAFDEVQQSIALPTSGVFAEAVLGSSIAAEKVDADYAKWGSVDCSIPILPPKIADLQSRDRAKPMDLRGQDLSTSLAQLRASNLADISHIDKVLAQAGNGQMFRNMGGLEQTMSVANNLSTLTANEASHANDKAVELQKHVLSTFQQVLSSGAGQAVISEYMVPGSGRLVAAHKDKGGQIPAGPVSDKSDLPDGKSRPPPIIKSRQQPGPTSQQP